jgi:hypothetical protein
LHKYFTDSWELEEGSMYKAYLSRL